MGKTYPMPYTLSAGDTKGIRHFLLTFCITFLLGLVLILPEQLALAYDPLTYNPSITDTDGDGVMDAVDIDDDNDGIVDKEETDCQEQLSFNDAVESATVGENSVPQGWTMCTPATDIHSGNGLWGVNLTPFEGNKYQGFHEPEAYSAPLENQFAAGQSYNIEVATRVANIVPWPSNYPTQIKIYGGSSACSRTQLLATTTIRNNEAEGWLNEVIPIAPNANFSYLTVDSDSPGSTGYILVDNFKVYKSQCTALDHDNDNIPDFIDIDSDNDGIPDNIEAQSTAGYIAPSTTWTDVNGNGLDDIYEPGLNGEGLTPVDTDGDGITDMLDLDSDDTETNDTAEAGLTLTSLVDTDEDGLVDVVDTNDSAWGPVNAGITNILSTYPKLANQVLWRSFTYDYGDAPDTAVGVAANNYQTTQADNGPRHQATDTLYLGTTIDTEANALQNAAANADDTTDSDDENGILYGPLSTTSTNYSVRASVTNNSGNAANLYVWMDWNRNGNFEASERLSQSVPSAAGQQTVDLTWNSLPITPVNATTYYLRARLTTDTLSDNLITVADEASIGAATDGEVEDYAITATNLASDYGDLPDSYSTTLFNGGPYHTYDPYLFLGTGAYNQTTLHWDSDNNGQPSSNADGDDTTGGTPDDEGDNPGSIVALPIPTTGSTYSLQAKFMAYAGDNANHQLRAWIDWNKDGQFSSTEASTLGSTGTQTSITQTVTLNWSSVDKSALAQGDKLALRVRLTTDPLSDTSWGGAASDGEVEDHYLFVGDFDYGDAPDTTNTTGQGNYQTLFENGGPGHGVRAGLSIGATLTDAEASITTTPQTGYSSMSSNATVGDNTTGVDEDIIPSTTNPDFYPPGTGSSSYSLRIPITNTTGSTAYLVGWYDANNDGDFADNGEQSTTLPISADGNYTVSWAGFTNANTTATTYKAVRLRLSTDTTLNSSPSPYGLLTDGEVEDLLVQNMAMVSGYLYFDSNNSLSHATGETGIANISVYLYADTNGNRILEASEATTPLATATTAADGYYQLLPPANGNYLILAASNDPDMPANVSYTGTVNGALGNTTATTVATTTGTTNNNPIAINYTGAVQTNKDFPFNALDFGDAPDSYGTNITNSGTEGIGTSHTLGLAAWIGNTAPDADADGQPNASADGDNTNSSNDEDGLVLPNLSSQASSYTAQVRVVNQSATTLYLTGWLDRNANGKFDDGVNTSGNGTAEESAYVTIPANSTAWYPLTWTGLTSISASQTYLRLRLSNDYNADPTGASIYGEVEDHLVNIDSGPAACGVENQLDVVFVMDNGTNITASEYTAIRTTLNKAIDAYTASGADVKVAVAEYTGTAATTQQLNIRQDFTTAGASAKTWTQGTQTGAAANLSDALVILKNALDGNPDSRLSGVTTSLSRRTGAQLVVVFVTDTITSTYLGNTGYTGSNLLKAEPYAATLIGLHLNTTASNNQYAAANTSLGGSYSNTLAANAGDPQGSGGTPRRLLTALSTAIPPGMGGAIANYSCLSKQDFGDAPDTSIGYATGNYATTLLDDGPRHTPSSTLYLGTGMPDVDADGQQNTTATGDDNVGSDDENGVNLSPLPVGATSYTIKVKATNTSGKIANVYAWVDWNRDGYFEGSEAKLIPVPSTAGEQSIPITWTGLPTLTNGTTYVLRVRTTTDNLQQDATNTTRVDERSQGAASDGEVEDHLLTATTTTFDYGDLPDSYATTAVNGGPYHAYDPYLFIGTGAYNLATAHWDSEVDGQLSSLGKADKDDTSGSVPDDEAGINAAPMAINASSYSLNVSLMAYTAANNDAKLRGWIDFNGDGQFTTDEASTVTLTGTNASTTKVLTLNWPDLSGVTLKGGVTALRVRLTTDALSDANWGGYASDGEVEDHTVSILGADYGDAPASYGSASHNVSNNARLGSLLDFDSGDWGDGTDNMHNASDDDTANDPTNGVDDEDGISSVPDLASTDTSYTLTVNASNADPGKAATIYAWLDTDRNGTFDADEIVTQTIPANTPAADYTLNWTLTPAQLATGVTYARVRITTDTLSNTNTPTSAQDTRSIGVAADGEAEDYPINITYTSPSVTNPATTDTDGDGVMDNVDIDDDNDGVVDCKEQLNATNPFTGSELLVYDAVNYSLTGLSGSYGSPSNTSWVTGSYPATNIVATANTTKLVRLIPWILC